LMAFSYVLFYAFIVKRFATHRECIQTIHAHLLNFTKADFWR
jgi:hypothetical protein